MNVSWASSWESHVTRPEGRDRSFLFIVSVSVCTVLYDQEGNGGLGVIGILCPVHKLTAVLHGFGCRVCVNTKRKWC